MGNPKVAPRAFLFDVFGTVVDWRSSVARGLQAALAPRGITADWAGIADAWRGLYEPSMEPVRAGQAPYVDLDTLHRASLETVLAGAGIGGLPAALLDDLTRLWHVLDPWPDSAEGLRRLGALAPCGACSNGHVALIVALSRHGGLRWDAVLGAATARNYKPHPSVYLESAAAFGVDPGACMMVAAHNADLRAAAALGFRTAFVRRPTEHGPGQTLDLEPEDAWDVVTDSLTGLAEALGG